MNTIKAIETKYKGYRFRSRLEARWAVFFDVMGLKFDYEHEGFDLPAGYYLPDFFVHLWGCYVEIKPTQPTDREVLLCDELRHLSGKDVLMIIGNPWPDECHFKLFISGQEDWEQEIAEFDAMSTCRYCDAFGLSRWGYLDETQLERCFPDCYRPHWDTRHDRLAPVPDGNGRIIGCPCSKPLVNIIPESVSGKDRISKAILAARSARFEHGESP